MSPLTELKCVTNVDAVNDPVANVRHLRVDDRPEPAASVLQLLEADPVQILEDGHEHFVGQDKSERMLNVKGW